MSDTPDLTPDTLARIAARLDKPVVLVGLMGCGKSCVGRRVAAKLGLAFKDSDAEFEQAAGMTISEYFAQHGEPAFREGERRVLGRLMELGPSIIATGGGAFMDEETRKRILDGAISVWLRADLDLLVKRTSGRDHRPLLKTGDPRQMLAGLMNLRYPTYGQARIIVDTTDESPDVTVDKVLEQLKLVIGA